MIPSFIIRILWDLNVKHYKFKYNGYDTYHKWDIPAFLGCVRPIYFKEDYDFKSYFHYVWNIKSE